MFISTIIIDYIWLGIITRKFIINQFGPLVRVKNESIQINLLVGLLAWFVIALGVYIFAIYLSTTFTKTLVLGAIFGFISYSIYDLTNLTFIVNYPIKFVFVDIVWGTVLCTLISAVGFFIKSLF